MRLHWLQHVPFEGLGSINDWATRRGCEVTCTRLYAGDSPPDLENFDFLIVMGGPMGIYDEREYPWLRVEKEFLAAAIKAGKAILGICLGAQLLASVLGAEVRGNGQREIGWFPLYRCPELPASLSSLLPDGQNVFHWHGDTFDIPSGAQPLWFTTACKNQAFLFGSRILGLQFHLETTPESLAALIENCRNELVRAPWVQTAEEMLKCTGYFANINTAMAGILDVLAP